MLMLKAVQMPRLLPALLPARSSTSLVRRIWDLSKGSSRDIECVNQARCQPTDDPRINPRRELEPSP